MERIIEFKSDVLPYADGRRGELSVKLGDIYKTGNVQFSIRVSTQVADSAGRWHEESWGINRQFIENRFEDLLPLLDLHGCCVDGAPLKAVAEGSYLFRNGRYDEAVKLLRITHEEADQLLVAAPDPSYFSYLLHKLGVVERWNEHARQLICWLDLNCPNVKFDEPLPESLGISKSDIHKVEKIMDIIRDDELNGLYTPEKIASRYDEQLQERLDKERAAINASYEEQVKKAEVEREVRLSILEAGILSRNVIFYSHDQCVCFNWSYSHPLIPSEDIERYIETIGNVRFPDYKFKDEKMGNKSENY